MRDFKAFGLNHDISFNIAIERICPHLYHCRLINKVPSIKMIVIVHVVFYGYSNLSNCLSTYVLLTLNVQGPSYLGLTRSIPWLLMPWLLASPGHQQP